MSILKSISYQLEKFNLRKIKLPRVDGIIFSENSSDHWQFVTVNEMNVLDLGFGRWGINEVAETSPVYFKSKNAIKIIGVDANNGEVEFFQKYFSENFDDGSTFICKYVKSSEDIGSLISKYGINTIKCDIEGAEIHLYDLKLQNYPSVKYVSIEYHSLVLLKKLLLVNNTEWQFEIINHSIFSEESHMGVVTLVKK